MIIEAPDLPISFAVCVGPDYNPEWLDALIQSIKAQKVPEYEILLVFNKGTKKYDADLSDNIQYLETDGWIPQKKNLISWMAQYENLVIVHDYYLFDDDWYDGVKEFNASVDGKWQVVNNFVLRGEDGERGPDWVINPNYMKKFLDNPENSDILSELKSLYPTENHPMYVVGLSPHEKRLTPLQYVSGGFIMCKKFVLIYNQFDENMKPGESEDLEWFERIKKSRDYAHVFNPFSIVYTQKPNKWRVFQLPSHHIERLKTVMDKGFFEQHA